MKTIINLISITAVLMILMQGVFSQEVSSDSLKTGQTYKILLSSDEWITGEILSSDSVYIKIKQPDGTAYKFYKKQIKTFIVQSKEDMEEYYSDKYSETAMETKEIMKPRLSLSGGLGLTTLFETSDNNPASYVFNLEGSIYMSRNAGVRLFVDCNFLGNGNNYSSYGPEYYSYEEGGNTSIYIVTADLLLGSLKPEQKTSNYFICGIGAFIYSESDHKDISSYGTYTSQGSSSTAAVLKIGYGINHRFSPKITAGGELLYGTPFQYLYVGLFSIKPKIGYNISKKIELFVEPQYTFPLAFGEDGGFFAGTGYLTIKTGITFSSF